MNDSTRGNVCSTQVDLQAARRPHPLRGSAEWAALHAPRMPMPVAPYAPAGPYQQQHSQLLHQQQQSQLLHHHQQQQQLQQHRQQLQAQPSQDTAQPAAPAGIPQDAAWQAALALGGLQRHFRPSCPLKAFVGGTCPLNALACPHVSCWGCGRALDACVVFSVW
jgi:hypothetical protein